jgi:FAD/FMN-containing dehydrogenase
VWPRRYRRSDVYHRLVRLEHRYQLAARVDAWRGRPARERVVQDVEIPLERTAEYLRWFLATVPLTPIWLCPVALREAAGPGSARSWPLYPMSPGRRYVNVGFWGTVPIRPGEQDGDVNRAIEAKVSDLDGHKSLYSDVYYTQEAFARKYGGTAYQAAKATYDPDRRLAELYDKAVGP